MEGTSYLEYLRSLRRTVLTGRIIEMKITYFKIPLGSIPFKEIPTLEHFSHRYVWCSVFSLFDFMGLDYDLLSVYDAYDDQVNNLDDLDDDKLLFGKVVSDKTSHKGKNKVYKNWIFKQAYWL